MLSLDKPAHGLQFLSPGRQTEPSIPGSVVMIRKPLDSLFLRGSVEHSLISICKNPERTINICDVKCPSFWRSDLFLKHDLAYQDELDHDK
jgi:hypothetical protein